MNKFNEKEEKSEKKHVCGTCGASFNRPYRLTQHLLLHQNIKIFQCGEEGCDKSYTSKSHLDRHLYTVHIKTDFDVLHRCPYCMKNFSNRQNLKRHVKIKHTVKDAFSCDVCQTNFKKKHLLLTHMYHHTLVKPFSCDLCDKSFVSLLEKKRHLKYHKTYTCESCDMAFNHWSKYLKHKKTEHDATEYVCNECGRKFKQRCHIVHHIKKHTSAKQEPKKFICWYEDCNRVYSRNSNLKQHVEIKHMQITHTCQICDVRLSSKTVLKKHLKTHCKPEDLSMKHMLARLHPKTKESGRKERKDKGSFKNSTALKILGLIETKAEEPKEEVTNLKKSEQNESQNVVNSNQNTQEVSQSTALNLTKSTVESDKNIDENVRSSIIISVGQIDKLEAECQAVTSKSSHSSVATS